MKKAAIIVETMLGVGHMRRAAAMARGLQANDLEVHIITSENSYRKGQSFDYGKAIFPEFLPSFERNPDTGTANLPPLGFSRDEIHAKRRDNMISHLRQIRPDTVITESWPFGRGRYDSEFTPAIELVKNEFPQTQIFCLIREVLCFMESRIGTNAEMRVVDLINRYFDGVISTSDQRYFVLGDTFPCSHLIRKPIFYPGFFVNKAAPRSEILETEREVIVSSGGGYTVNSCDLFEAAIKTKTKTEFNNNPWRFFVSNDCPDVEFARLQQMAEVHRTEHGSITVQRFSTAFQNHMANAAAIISEVGQTMAEAIDVKTTACNRAKDPVTIVAVPRYNPNESGVQEQVFKAQAYQSKGLLSVAMPVDIASPEVFAALINAEKARSIAYTQNAEAADIKVDAANIAADWIKNRMEGPRRHRNLVSTGMRL